MMTRGEAAQLITLINAIWSQRPLDGAGAGLVAGMISRYEARDVHTAIEQLARAEEWFHVSKLIKLLEKSTAPELPSAAEVYRKIRAAVLVYAPGEEFRAVGNGLQAVVGRLGGWGTVRAWPVAGEEWRIKAVDEAIEHVRARGEIELTEASLALRASRRPALPSAHVEEPEQGGTVGIDPLEWLSKRGQQ